MTSKGKCRLCGEEVSFTIGNPVELGFHMIDRHNSGSVGQYDILEEYHKCVNTDHVKEEELKACPDKSCAGKRTKVETKSAGVGSCRASYIKSGETGNSFERIRGGKGAVQVDCNCNAKRKTKGERGGKGRRRHCYSKGLYKTTLETWTSAGGYVTCPSCGKEVRPLVRSQKNKVAYTSVGATFLLSCWPCCFLFPLMHKCSIDLYCPNCKYALGTYDASSGKTRANDQVPNMDQIDK